MKYLSLDYGSKRIGVAVSDDDGKIAFPKIVLDGSNPYRAIEKIKGITELEKVHTIIVGLPISFSGEESSQAETVRRFAKVLSDAVQLPVEFENEILSSRIGERAGVPREHLDASAAAIILQSYLDKQNS